MAEEEKTQTYPMAVLIEELKSEDIKRRANSVKNIASIAIALGPEKTRIELLPFIGDFIDDEDEVLVSLAEALGSFIDYIGGGAYAMHLIKPLEQLSSVEENNVREKAVESLKKVFTEISIEANQEEIMNVVRRLVNGEWYSTKIAGISLVPSIFLHVSAELQKELITIIKKCAKDEVPQVRRTAAASLKDLIEFTPKFPEEEAIGLNQDFMKDEQDSVRLMCLDNFLALKKFLPDKIGDSFTETFLQNYFNDKSWRIRYVMIEKLTELFKVTSKSIFNNLLLQCFVSSLQDAEGEVKIISISKLGELSLLIDKELIFSQLIPNIKKLSTDPQPLIRKMLAEHILGLATVLGPEKAKEHILPILAVLFGDEQPDTRTAIILNIEGIAKVVGFEAISPCLSPALTKYGLHANWRTRLSTVDYYPLLAKLVDEKVFANDFLPICFKWFEDNIFAVREGGILCMKKLTAQYGYLWSKKHIVPQLQSLAKNPNYLKRVVPLIGYEQIIDVIPFSDVLITWVPLLNNLAKDKVPNIRLYVAKCVVATFNCHKEAETAEDFVKLLNMLSKDSEKDVRSSCILSSKHMN